MRRIKLLNSCKNNLYARSTLERMRRAYHAPLSAKRILQLILWVRASMHPNDHIALCHASGLSLTFHNRITHVRESVTLLDAGLLRDPLRSFEIRDLPALEGHFIEAGRRLEKLAESYPNEPGVAAAVASHEIRKASLQIVTAVWTLPPIPSFITHPTSDTLVEASLVVALLALIVAVITLIRVNRQIVIATEELQAVKDDFKLSQDQFDLAQKQYRELSRRPRLAVGAYIAKPADIAPTTNRFTVGIYFRNHGDKIARNIRIEICIDKQHFNAFESAASMPTREAKHGGIDYKVFTADFGSGFACYPDDVPHDTMLVPMSMLPSNVVAASFLLFRIYDDNFAYPPTGYGKVEYRYDTATPLEIIDDTD